MSTEKKYPNAPCHWWPDLTPDDANEHEIEAVRLIAGDPMGMLLMTREQARENYKECAKHLREYAKTTQTAAAPSPALTQAVEAAAREERIKGYMMAGCVLKRGEPLAYELLAGEIADLRTQLASLQSAAEAGKVDGERLALVRQWVNEGRGTVEFGITHDGQLGVWLFGEEKARGVGNTIAEAIDSARSAFTTSIDSDKACGLCGNSGMLYPQGSDWYGECCSCETGRRISAARTASVAGKAKEG